MSAPDWKRIAAERLRRIRFLEAQTREAEVHIREAIEMHVHAMCLAGMKDPVTQRFIAAVTVDFGRCLRGDLP